MVFAIRRVGWGSLGRDLALAGAKHVCFPQRVENGSVRDRVAVPVSFIALSKYAESLRQSD